MSNPFGLTEDAIAVLRGEVKDVSGFTAGGWRYRCAEQLSTHKGILTSDEAKAIAKEHKTQAKFVQEVRRKLRKAGMWDDRKGGLSKVFALYGVHLKPKKGDDATKGEDGKDKSDKETRPPKGTSEETSTTKKI